MTSLGMDALCAIGIHRWKPHYVATAPRQEQFMHLVIPGLFTGPPLLMPTGIYYTTTVRKVCDRCRRCGMRR